MTCPTCQGRRHLADLSHCATCYATGAEPVYGDTAVIAARLSLCAASLAQIAEDPKGSAEGRRAVLVAASKARAASIRMQAPSPARDQEARIIALQLVEAGADAHSFYSAVRAHLTAHGRARLVSTISLRVQQRAAEITRRIAVRYDC